jgi:DNA-binding winged helix-turn-helix (wHTH) protein/tetratricopeptide (TPR) repeat protein
MAAAFDDARTIPLVAGGNPQRKINKLLVRSQRVMHQVDNLTYEFGPYRLNLTQRSLIRDGETVALTPKAIEILVRLVANAGVLVEKDDLLREVWPETFVEESNLTQNIFILRRALGDERAEPKYIETVARRGYRFVASVRVVANASAPSQVDGEESVAEAGVGPGANSDVDSATTQERVVIAVMPFINATGEEGLEYLAEGLTDNIINNLSRVSRLRVMSRSAVFRYNVEEMDPRLVGKELSAKAVLVGRIQVRPGATTTAALAPTGADGHAGGNDGRTAIVITAELVEVATGWQLWGESFDSSSADLLQIQEAITRQLLANLKLKLTGEEEKHVTARYTENPAAYQAYLEGRYHWSRYTRPGIEKAIGHFREAIEEDPNYALAYAAIVDCYLRLATNYLPPEEDLSSPEGEISCVREATTNHQTDERIKLRFRWDWKGVERELRRANELKTNYPSIHQWYVAHQTSKRLYSQSLPLKARPNCAPDPKLPPQIPFVHLTQAEEVQILCSVARDQLAIGNYDAAKLILQRWCAPGKWPNLNRLNAYTAADLLFTSGTLLGCIAGTKQVLHGHRQAEAFLNGSIALFEQVGIKSRSTEARIELTRCYYRQGLLDIAKETISTALSELPEDETELKTLALIIRGVIERDSGRLKQSLTVLKQAASIEAAGCLVTGRCNIDLATTLKEIGLTKQDEQYLAEAEFHFLRALYESEALGHHRNVASAENNLGFLFLDLRRYEESEPHLVRARRVFEALSDSVRGAQVNDTLARLYLETKQHVSAQEAIDKAVETLLLTDSEALLAEALTTKAIIASKRGQLSDAKRSFEAAHRVAQRCGDYIGVARALLGMFEEIGTSLDLRDTVKIAHELRNLLPVIQQPSLITRIELSVARVRRLQKTRPRRVL